MARSLGLYLQSHGFRYVLLEGSGKRFQVKASGDGQFRADEAGHPKRLGKHLADVVKEAVKSAKADQVIVTLPAGGVVMRELSLPFSEREKVMQVLKYEIEGELYHLSADDVVCDFIELEDGRATPTLLTSVLPKERLAGVLAVVDGADWDPPVITLEQGSLLTALRTMPRPEAGSEGQIEVYLHVAAESSVLLLLNPDGGLRGVRAIPLGWRELTRGLESQEVLAESEEAAMAEAEILDESGEVVAVAELASEESSSEDAEMPEPGAEGAGKNEEEEEATDDGLAGDLSLPFGLSLEDALAACGDEAQRAFRQKLTAEVRRGLAALGSSQGPVYLCGALLPGLDEELARRLGREVAPLDLGFADESGHAPDAVALGAALRGLGEGNEGMNFRQEEFRYARGLERIEGPLTLALVGLIFWFVLDLALNVKVAQGKQADYRDLYARADQKVEALNTKVQDDEEYPDEWLIQNDFGGLDLAEDEKLDQLSRRVNKAKVQLDELMGESALEMPPSSLEAWRLLMDFLEEEMKDYPDRWMIENIEFTSMDRSASQGPHVKTRFGITLFGDNGLITSRIDRLERDLSAKPWVMNGASLPETKDGAVPDTKTGTMTLEIITEQPREEGGKS